AQPAHADDEEIDRVGKQREADDELVGARAQYEPDAGSGKHADGDCERQLHCWRSSSCCRSSSRRAARRRRIDWWAMAISISTVAPTTSVDRKSTRLNSSHAKISYA